MSNSGDNIARFQDILGVQFCDEDLLTQALTHSSFANEYGHKDSSVSDNERLEFLGDAVLDIVVTDMLYHKYLDVSEGELTRLRSALVRTESLAHIGRQFQIGQFLRIGHGEEITGGRQRVTTLCRAFEAIIGAMYLDSGMETVKGFVTPSLLKFLDYVLEYNLHIDARSELQEQIQARLSIEPIYRLAGEQGPEHAREFHVEVSIGESIIGSGSGASKRAAAQDAARAALEVLEAVGLPEFNETEDQPPDQNEAQPPDQNEAQPPAQNEAQPQDQNE